MQHLDGNVAEIKILIICKCSEVEGNVCRLVQTIISAGYLGQPNAAGEMIGLYVSVDNILDRHPLRACKLYVSVNVFRLWVHDRGPCFTGSTKEVSGAACVVIKVLSKDHLLSVNVSGFGNEHTNERMIREMNCANHYDRSPLSFFLRRIGHRPHGRSSRELNAILSNSAIYTVAERTVPRGDELDHR